MINRLLKKMQIRHKLIMLNLLITGIVFLIAVVILLITEYVSFKDSLLHDLTIQAKIVAGNSTASLVFNDQKAAGETLSALKTSPNIECAVIYARNGTVFATYRRPDMMKDMPPVSPPKDGHSFDNKKLSIVQGIALDRERIGTIYIRSDLKKLHFVMIQNGAVALFTLLFVFIVAYALMSKWHRVIIEPIMNLFQVMKLVSWEKNYTLQAHVYSEDEIGSLAQGFNEMLEQIRERDTKLLAEIAERKEAEDRLRQAKEEWERTFDAIVDPVMITDAQHQIIKANKAMAAKLGISPADAEGLACYNAVHGVSEPPLFCPHSKLLADGKPHSVENYEERLGGYFIVSVSPLFDLQGEVYGSVHYARDITERIKAEESVQRMNEELERKVEERTKQLLDAQEDLVRNEKLAILGQLSGSVGHELRNPLGVMNNAVYFLKTVMAGGDETVMEYLDIIKHEINNSERIITDLLDFARTKPPRKLAVMAGDLMGESLARCALPENVDIQMDIPDKLPPLNVDPLQMQQVFQNLISNAIQSMPEGGALSIGARLLNNGGAVGATGRSPLQGTADFIEICIADTGVGISPENMKKLFHPLFTTKAKGVGLGLTVCRNLTEANGGRIEVESELGNGTRIIILLPVGG
jgi:PAS domain S-box-containing protein